MRRKKNNKSLVARRREVLFSASDRGLGLRVEELTWTSPLWERFNELMETTRYNLNGARDNAVAEALALASIYKQGPVLAERDLVRVSGMGQIVRAAPSSKPSLEPTPLRDKSREIDVRR